MLEEDYLALDINKNSTKHGLGNITEKDLKFRSLAITQGNVIIAKYKNLTVISL